MLTHRASSYFSFLAKSRSRYTVHSPSVFEFINKVFRDKTHHKGFARIQQLRKDLLANTSRISGTDYGAGSQLKSSSRTVKSFCRSTALPHRFGRILYNLSRHVQPQTILEMGTGLGISTAYLALPSPKARILSLEGNPTLAQIAIKNFEGLDLSGVQVKEGEFSITLPGALSGLGKIDLALVDGNHRLEPTINYFEAILPHIHEHSVLVFDDINWSSEMETAWEEIRNHPAVNLSINIYRMGFLFFRKDLLEPQHFWLRI